MSQHCAEPLRIMFVTNGSRPGDYQAQFLSYARHFSGIHQLSILFMFAIDNDSPIVKEFRSLGVSVYSLGIRSRVSPLSIYRAYRYFLSVRPRFIHSQHPIAGVNAKVAGRFYRWSFPEVKIICEQRNMPEGLSWLARKLEYLTFPMADLILCSSTRVEKSYFGSSEILDLRNFSPRKRKHYTFFNSIDTAWASQEKTEKQRAREFLAREWGIGARDFVVVTVGKMTKQKDYPTLISGFAKVRQDCSARGLKLICVGDGPEESSLRSLAQRLDIQGSVIFAGYRSDVRLILSGADCFVLTSLWEGLPKALLEAMIVPLPCVATQVAGIEDVIRHDVDGILISPRSVRGLSEALSRVVDDTGLRMRLAGNAADRVKLFSAQQQSRTLLGIYEKLARCA